MLYKLNVGKWFVFPPGLTGRDVYWALLSSSVWMYWLALKQPKLQFATCYVSKLGVRTANMDQLRVGRAY